MSEQRFYAEKSIRPPRSMPVPALWCDRKSTANPCAKNEVAAWGA
jgi:hypothetical protein